MNLSVSRQAALQSVLFPVMSAALLFFALGFLAEAAFAAQTPHGGVAIPAGTETTFQNLYARLFGWITGFLGRALALTAFIIGLGLGAIKQNGLIALSGIMFAVFIVTVPNIIDTMIAATI
jgi:conjugal transfer pilus assembly protein TraA